jgi:ribosomal-protein-alanine N-acetyltransferase
LHAFASDVENVQYMDWGPNSKDDTNNFLSDVQNTYQANPRKAFEFAVIFKSTNQLIGSCGIRIQSNINRHGDFGYILSKAYWNQRLGKELAAELVRFGFSDLKLHRIWATCAPDNIASQTVLERIGLKKEGHLRQNIFHRGQWRDSILYSILEGKYDL